MRVVVVGAGLAGLNAATILRAHGVDVVVVEGGNRVGGRTRTVRAPFIDGQYSESGAEWVDDHHRRMHALMERYGLRPLGAGERWMSIRRWLHHGGRMLDPEAVRLMSPSIDDEFERFDGIVAEATRGIVDASAPQLHAEATRLDSLSLADVAAQAELGELAALFKRRESQGEFAAEQRQVSLLFVAQQRAYERDATDEEVMAARRVEGGVSQIAEGLATELGGIICFDELLTGVAQDADGVTVRTSRRTLQADHVVLACSLVPLRSVDFHDALPPLLSRAVQELGYGTVTKTSVQWSARQWPAGYATTERRVQRVYDPTAAQPGEAGILMAYCGGDGGHEWATLTEPERLALAADEMRVMHQLTADSLGGFSRAWSTEPRYGGSYAVYEPGQVTEFWDVLRQPWGRVHLCGEHVATCTGYMEGALESGETVAHRLVDAG